MSEIQEILSMSQNEKPKSLSSNELTNKARVDFGKQISNGTFTEEELKQFVQEKVTGVKINGVEIVLIDFDHKDQEVNPIAKAYIESPRTRTVVAEYFYPELKRNADSSRLTQTGAKLGFSDWKERLSFAGLMAKACKEADKPVAVCDIANKASYLVANHLLRTFPLIASFLGYTATKDIVFSAPYMAGLAWNIEIGRQVAKGKGLFNKENVTALDKFALDFEQARRLYLAKGLEQLTKEYPPLSQEDKKDPQIVVLYPRAHGIRVKDILLDPNPLLNKAKDFVYKLFGPNLDYNVRTWEWKDSLQSSNESSNVNPDNWMLVSNRKIKI